MKKTLYSIVAAIVLLLIWSTAHAASILQMFQGGTGWGNIVAHTVVIGNGTNALSTTSPSNAGFVLTSNGVGADPTFQAVTASGTIGTTTNLVAGQAIYASGPSTVASIGTSTPATGTGISYSGTLGNFFGGTSGTLTNTGVTSLLAGTGISLSGSTGAVTVTATGGGSGIGTVSTSTVETAGQLGAWGTTSGYPAKLYSVATSSLTVNTPLTTAGTIGALVGGTSLTVGCQTASGSQAGCLSSTDWNTFNSKQATISSTWPIVLTGATLSFGGLSTSSPAVVGNLPYFSGVNTFANVATSSLSNGSGISFSGTAGAIVGGSGFTINNTGLLSLQQLGGGTAQAGAITLATSSQTTNGLTVGLNITNISGAFTLAPTISGTLTAAGGGTGQSSYSTGDLLYASGAAALSKLGVGTPGQVLGVVGGVPAWVATSTSSGITGSGATGQATFWTGAGTVSGDNGFWWDNTNKFLGIGSTTPFSVLTALDTSTTTNAFSVWQALTASSTNTQTFAASGTWTKPAGFVSATVQVVGGGGGSGGTTDFSGVGGGGGGSSSFAAGTPCIAVGGGGGGAGGTTGGGTGGGTGATGGGTGGSFSSGSNRAGGGGGGADLETCTYLSAGVGSTVTVTVGKGGTSPAGSAGLGGTGLFAGGNSVNGNPSGGGGGGGSTAIGSNASAGTGGAGGTGASSGGVVTHGTAGGNGGVATGGTAGTGGLAGNTAGNGNSGAPAASGNGQSGFDGTIIVTSVILNTSPQFSLGVTAVMNGYGNTEPYVGIGTSTPMAKLSILAGSSTPPFAVASSLITDLVGTVVNYVWEQIDIYGHLETGGPAPTAASCAGFAVTGDDRTGKVSFSTATACSMNFARPWRVTPICVANSDAVLANLRISAISTTQVTFTASTNITDLDYICQAHH